MDIELGCFTKGIFEIQLNFLQRDNLENIIKIEMLFKYLFPHNLIRFFFLI